MAKLQIHTPKSVSTKGGRLAWGGGFAAAKSAAFARAQAVVDSETLRFCARRVPVKTGRLRASAAAGGGEIGYTAPYARAVYARQPWFEQGKAEEKENIRAMAARAAGGG